MILFTLHLVIALVLAYILTRAALESGGKNLILPLAGIVALFIMHCATSRESCLECAVTEPRCMAEIVLFWVFTIWAALQLIRGDRK